MRAADSAPVLQKLKGNVHQLLVQGKPLLMRAAEIHNSSASCLRTMSRVWPQMVENNVNTVLAPIGWETIEPEEGVFDFEHLDRLIHGAREHNLKLILLWFGSFKNGQSTYAPSWVKLDAGRFPRAAINKDGKTTMTGTLSVFHEPTARADAKAFEELTRHLRQVDQTEHTVVMVQVQNEVGLLGDTRDRSAPALEAYSAPVPAKLLETLAGEWDSLDTLFTGNFPNLSRESVRSASGSWAAVFGASDQTDELFMAYHYARYLDIIAREGKETYPIPMFTNVWLRNLPEEKGDVEAFVGGGVRPGDYPSGGAVETVLDIWQLFAPSLDFIAPDIYLSDYSRTCEYYTHRDQALFIPEQRRDEYGALRTWEAVGRLNAIATSPFAIDSHTPELSPFTLHYGLLKSVSAILLDARARGVDTYGFFFDRFEKGQKDPSSVKKVRMGEWDLTISRSFTPGHPSPGFGLIIQRDVDVFLLVGEGYMVRFESIDPRATYNGVLSIHEKEVVDESKGELGTLRVLNGDEGGFGMGVVMPATEIDIGDFPIPAFVPATTRVSECVLYYIKE